MIQRRVPVSLKTEEARATLEVLRRAATHATNQKFACFNGHMPVGGHASMSSILVREPWEDPSAFPCRH